MDEHNNVHNNSEWLVYYMPVMKNLLHISQSGDSAVQ
mgnify:FL=1